jgi:hypothetical protein
MITRPFENLFEIIPDDTGRCEALTLPSYPGDLPAFRCVREATLDRNSRRVCEAHSYKLRIRYFDDAPGAPSPD